jgi:nitroreductase/Pyruvate/2-oxoacid:ferredoxin oxidoreductase delta subunit
MAFTREGKRMIDTVPVRIDAARCTGCGRCCDVCPDATITLQEGKAVVSGSRCLVCGHCAAVCPEEAVSVEGLAAEATALATLHTDNGWTPYGGCDAATLVALMRSRRSCRHFTGKPIERAVLADLIRIGVTAPSGTNCQAWTFNVLATRPAVLRMMEELGRFFMRLNRLARIPALRFLSRIGDGVLDSYYHRYYESVEKALADWRQSGKDSLFHGAPAVILVGSRPGASTPAEDALLATQNILLGAHAMGLGSCLIGFAVAAMKREPRIQRRLGIPKEEAIHAVVALGYTDQAFSRPAGRKTPVVRFLSP